MISLSYISAQYSILGYPSMVLETVVCMNGARQRQPTGTRDSTGKEPQVMEMDLLMISLP